MKNFSLDSKINELHRELLRRKQFYARKIESGLMTRDEANHRYLCLESILKDYVDLKEEERKSRGKDPIW